VIIAATPFASLRRATGRWAIGKRRDIDNLREAIRDTVSGAWTERMIDYARPPLGNKAETAAWAKCLVAIKSAAVSALGIERLQARAIGRVLCSTKRLVANNAT
jgi:hypothetical protein